MKFDTEKRDKIIRVLERTWLVSLKVPSGRTMVADLITKELFGDDEGRLNNTAYGDTPTAVVAKTEVKESVKVPRKSEKETAKPVVQSKLRKTTLKNKSIKRGKRDATSRLSK